MDQGSVWTRCDNSEDTVLSWPGKAHLFVSQLLKIKADKMRNEKKKPTLQSEKL